MHPLFAVVPVVAHNPADRRRSAREKRAVAHRRDRRNMDVAGVGEHRALRQQPRQTAVIFAPETGEVIVAELIHYNRQHQLRFLRRRTSQAGHGQRTQQSSFHGITIFLGYHAIPVKLSGTS